MDLELTPEQPDAVAEAIELLVRPRPTTEPDPWWNAGLQEALETYPRDGLIRSTGNVHPVQRARDTA